MKRTTITLTLEELDDLCGAIITSVWEGQEGRRAAEALMAQGVDPGRRLRLNLPEVAPRPCACMGALAELSRRLNAGHSDVLVVCPHCHAHHRGTQGPPIRVGSR